MSMEYDDDLDEKLRVHLAAELDGQLGRAERAFRDEVRLATPVLATRLRTSRSHVWTIGAVGAAVAASMAAMWVVPVAPPDDAFMAATQPGGPGDIALMATPSEAAPDVSPQWQQVEQVVNSMTLDEGLVLLDDDTPARLVRQVSLEQLEWVDERRGLRVQAVVPREGARLIPIDTY